MQDHRSAGAAAAGAEGLAIGTRIAVKWDHGWEDGLVTAVRIDNKSKLRTYTITYDDGETHDDDLRKEADWRYLDAPPSAELQGGQQGAQGATRKRRGSGEVKGSDEAKGAGDGTEVRRTRHNLPIVAVAEGATEAHGDGAQAASATDATAADSDTSDDEPEQTWVSCDDCEKWRRVIDSQSLRSARRWRCSDNRDNRYSSCATPQAPCRGWGSGLGLGSGSGSRAAQRLPAPRPTSAPLPTGAARREHRRAPRAHP